MKKNYSYSKMYSIFQGALDERAEYEAEWITISEYLLPGRGIYQTYSKPRKRKLTSPKVVNNTGEDALYVLTSGMHGGLTSPSRPWFDLAWADTRLNSVEGLKAWLQECQEILHTALHASNFYSIINSFYIEYAGFGTGCMYVGEDTYDDKVPFRFELLTAGEYAFIMGADGKPAYFFRTVFMNSVQYVERFDKASEDLKLRVKNKEAGIADKLVTVLEVVVKDKYSDDMSYKRCFYEVATPASTRSTRSNEEPLEISGFYEFAYPVARWGTIGSDDYGLGPGSRALPDIKRLQEMEKAILMATHKAINPPLNVPARMRGKTKTLPGGLNYHANPQDVITEIYKGRFDYQGVGIAKGEVEERIQRNFFNDIFLTAARDPNASPLKAAQVQVQEQEKMLRLGPVIERLQHEFLQPVIERCFNICMRKELFPELPPDLQQMAGDYKISLISPLATAQRGVAMKGINDFIGFIGQAQQFSPTIVDNLDPDEAAREIADVSGVKIGILRTQDAVDKLRSDRANAQAKEKQRQDALAGAGMQSQMGAADATTRKTNAEAGEILANTQQTAIESGII